MLRRDFVQQVADRFGPKGAPVLRFRIGIHRGRAVVGNVGYQSKHRRLGTRFEYDCVGEALNVAVIASVMSPNPTHSAVTITRDVLVEETASGHDVLCATDLVAFAVRETSIFCHDEFPQRTYTALQLVGVCDAASLDLVRSTTRRFVVPLEDGNSAPPFRSGGGGGGGPVRLVALSKQFKAKCYDLGKARTAWREPGGSDSESDDTDTESNSGGLAASGSGSGSKKLAASSSSSSDSDSSSDSLSLSSSSRSSGSTDALRPSAAAAGDGDNDSSSSSGSTDSNFGLPHPRSVGRIEIVSGPKSQRHLSLGERIEMYEKRAQEAEEQRKQRINASSSGRRRSVTFLLVQDATGTEPSTFIDEKDDAAAAAASAARNVGQSRLQWELAQRTRAVNEQQRAMIARSAQLLRPHFYVDEPACDVLQAMSTAQRLFCRGTRDALKDALRLCRVMMKPMAAMEKMGQVLGTARHSQQTQHLSPESCAETKRLLLETRLNKSVLTGFMKCCYHGVRNPTKGIGTVLVVNLDHKAEY
jgi:hypothetical protein